MSRASTLAIWQQAHGLRDAEAAELLGLTPQQFARQKQRGPTKQTSILLLLAQTYTLDWFRVTRRANGAQLPDPKA